MKEKNETARLNGALSVALRLGCALLACAGIAVARGTVGAPDDASVRRAAEQAIAPVLDAIAVQESAQPSAKRLSVRPERRSRHDSRRLISFTAIIGPSLRSPQCSVAVSLPSAASAVPSSLPGSTSPRAPPVRA